MIVLLLLAAQTPPVSNVDAASVVRAFEQQSATGDFDAMLREGVDGFLEFRTVNNLADATADVVRERASGCTALKPDRDLPTQTPAGEILARVRFTCATKTKVDPCEGNLASIALVRSQDSLIAFIVPERGDEAAICPDHFQQIERISNGPHLKTSDLNIDAFLEDLRLGRTSEAANRIGKIESLSGLAPQFSDGPSYVTKVQACEPSQADKMPNGYRIAWKCADGDFFQVLSSQAGQSKLIVTEMMRKGYVPRVAAPLAAQTRQGHSN